MGDVFGKKDFVIANDGTIIRGDNKGNKQWLITLLILVSVITIGVFVYYFSKGRGDSMSYNEPQEWCDTVSAEVIEDIYSESEDNIPDGYVDLGLPSGTLWKNWNEEGDYHCEEAKKTFGSQLPTKKQWEELYDCEMTWGSFEGVKGRWVKGPNDYSIFLPAVCTNDLNYVSDEEYVGRYISSDEDSSCSATWIFYFDDRNYFTTCDYAVDGRLHSVRLVYDN